VDLSFAPRTIVSAIDPLPEWHNPSIRRRATWVYV
jgi:hypothetical protein